MNTRLQILMSRENLSASKLANFIGVQPSAISHILSGRNKPSYDFILKLAEAFPAYSLEWLLLGNEPMLKVEHNVSVSESNINEIAAEAPTDCNTTVTTEKAMLSTINTLENPEPRLFEIETTEKKKANTVEPKPLQKNIQVEHSPLMPSPSKNAVPKEAMPERSNEAPETEAVGKQRGDSGDFIGQSPCNVTKVMLFYEDNTFESYSPRNAK